MSLHIGETGILTYVGTDATAPTSIDLPSLGWDPARNFTTAAQIPCFIGGGFPLFTDLLVRSDEGDALAIVLTGFPLDDEEVLRVTADLYSNSAKRQFGHRPAVYFLEGDRCKVAYSLLGYFDEHPQILSKKHLVNLVAAHNVQEYFLFQAVLNDGAMAREFLAGKLDPQKTNAMLSEKLQQIEKSEFARHYREVLCPADEDRRKLPKQALLLAALGEKEYIAHCQKQTQVVEQILSEKSAAILRESVAADDWMPIPETSTDESRLLDWAFAYLGWDRAADLQKNNAVPCYLEPSMELPADYVFLDPKGKPILLFLRDNLHLTPEKAFVVAEYYSRSFKAAHGIAPFVIIYNDKGAYLKMGALSGGFEPIKQNMPKIRLAVHVAHVNVLEHQAWKALLDAVPSLQSIHDPQQRLQRQTELIQSSAKETAERIRDPQCLRAEFDAISSDTELLEEVYWKQLLGETQYQETRRGELQLLRTFAADKRIAGSM